MKSNMSIENFQCSIFLNSLLFQQSFLQFSGLISSAKIRAENRCQKYSEKYFFQTFLELLLYKIYFQQREVFFIMESQ